MSNESKKVKPLRPQDVVAAKKESLPDEVLEAFNELLAKNWNGAYSKIKQKDVVALILKKLNANRSGSETKRNSDYIFTNKFLDVEEIYAKEGWLVSYDKPAYCEDFYEPQFTFEKKVK